MPTALSDKSDEISVRIVKTGKKDENPTQTPTLHLNQSETYDFSQFIQDMRNTGGGWILLRGRYRERVRECVATCFRVLDRQGNLIEPKLVDLGTSCSLLRKSSGVELTDLKLNRQVLIDAVVYLRGASLGKMEFDKKMCALHVLNLSQMICEATKIKRMECYIDRHYLSNDFDTPNLTASLIELQLLWTEASRKVAGWASGKDTETFRLNGNTLTAEEVITMYPYTKGTTPLELEAD